LGDGLYNLALLDFYSLLELSVGKTYDPFDWMITGLNLTFMAWTSVVYLLLCILVEYAIMNQDFQNCLTKIMNVKLPPEGTDVRDDDVRAEENRVLSLPDDEEKPSILIKNFKHLYPGGKYAVKGISLGISKGECFGLLGTVVSLYWSIDVK
jgi:ATP-binding cassette subfamily A (ABC1) protein 1